MVIHKSFADFVLFLYVHMAHADSEFHETEMAMVREKMKKLYPQGTDYEAKLKEALILYQDFDKSKLHTLFKDTFRHFSDVRFSVKYHVYTDLHEIINADGKVDESETAALQELKEIIDLSH
ncbi:MAG: TerB family tellurite resistance protein [Cyclobacteriaceae bacterium]|nr:TerB family tellurite resistance protein [Cyclobacteriaceae bacterium]